MNTLLILAVILFSGLILGRAVKLLKLPNVTGYLIAGLLIGPYVLNIIKSSYLADLALVSEMALAFIAFSIGAEFKLSYLKKAGAVPIVIAIFEALMANLFVTVGLIILGFDKELSLLLGAIASATAPAATVMVIKQYNAKGPVTKTLLSVVALDDAVAIMAFGFSLAVVRAMINPGQGTAITTLIHPVVEIIGSIILGLVLGYLFNFPLRYFKKNSNRTIITVGFVFLAASVAGILGLSSLLLCMSMGAALINTNKSGLSIFGLVDNITPPIFLIFFVVSGAELNIAILPQIGLIGSAYVVLRVIGKILGAYAGGRLIKAPEAVQKYLGFTLIPQAGVAIGLSLIAAEALPGYGETIRAVILCGTLIYELIGPGITKISLEKAGEITIDKDKEKK